MRRNDFFDEEFWSIFTLVISVVAFVFSLVALVRDI